MCVACFTSSRPAHHFVRYMTCVNRETMICGEGAVERLRVVERRTRRGGTCAPALNQRNDGKLAVLHLFNGGDHDSWRRRSQETKSSRAKDEERGHIRSTSELAQRR